MKQKYLYILLLSFISFFGFSQEKAIEGLQIYPNPTTDQRVFVNTESFSIKEIEVYDLVGKKVYSGSSSSNAIELKLYHLKAGVYLIKIKEGDVVVTRKLILK